MLRLLRILAVVLFAVLLAPRTAAAWTDDFFDGGASGQAVYEDMAIAPEAVRVGRTVYVAYQGAELDSYIVAFDDSGAILGPYRIGNNPLSDRGDRDDSHGAPSLLYDPVRGIMHAYWGAHNSSVYHAFARLDDIHTWVQTPGLPGNITYPQAFRDDMGVAHLFYRTSDSSGATDSAGHAISDRQGWNHVTSEDGGSTWGPPTAVIRGTSDVRWYARFKKGANNTVHVALTASYRDGGPLDRFGLYYAKLDLTTGAWAAADGTTLAASGSPIPVASALATAPTAFALPVVRTERHNGMTIADDGRGSPLIVYVAGGAFGPDACRYEAAHHGSSGWTTATIAPTDFLMDSAAVEYAPGGELDAYLTVGGGQCGPESDPYSYRGGNLEQWRSDDDGTTWTRLRTLKSADPARGVVYNDPQIVDGHDVGGPRVLFGEWNNDVGNFVHKVFLWGPGGFSGREFFPQMQRLDGKDRYAVSAAVSREAFPLGADTVVVASGETPADALSGAPLARAYAGPILLVKKASVPPDVLAELYRLEPKTVIVLGGTGSISAATQRALGVWSVTKNRRISGPDRYAVASNVASELAAVCGRPATAFVVSGTAWADALSVASVAAARGLPVLLVRPGSVPSATADALRRLAPLHTVVAGGPATVSEAVVARLPGAVRISGADRYAVSAAIAEYALDGGPALAPTLRTDRIVVASGRVFADALSGSVLAARAYAPLVLADGRRPSPSTDSFLRRRAYRVVRCYILGGTGSITPTTAAGIADALRERQAQ